MPSTEARRRGDVNLADDALAATEGHVAQLIDPDTEGARTIVLTVDADSAATGSDPSILDGGLETTWVVPARGRRFSRDAVPAEELQATETAPATGTSTVTAFSSAASADAAEEPTAEHEVAPRAAVRPSRRRPASELAWAGDLTWSSAREAQQAEVREVVLTRAIEPGPAIHPAGTATADGELALIGAARPRRSRHPVERFADRPDTIALWAVFLGVVLILVAALS